MAKRDYFLSIREAGYNHHQVINVPDDAVELVKGKLEKYGDGTGPCVATRTFKGELVKGADVEPDFVVDLCYYEADKRMVNLLESLIND